LNANAPESRSTAWIPLNRGKANPASVSST
jgi:hypothetical protein